MLLDKKVQICGRCHPLLACFRSSFLPTHKHTHTHTHTYTDKHSHTHTHTHTHTHIHSLTYTHSRIPTFVFPLHLTHPSLAHSLPFQPLRAQVRASRSAANHWNAFLPLFQERMAAVLNRDDVSDNEYDGIHRAFEAAMDQHLRVSVATA